MRHMMLIVGRGVERSLFTDQTSSAMVDLQLFSLGHRLFRAGLGLGNFRLAVFGQLEHILPRLFDGFLGMVAACLVVHLFQFRQDRDRDLTE